MGIFKQIGELAFSLTMWNGRLCLMIYFFLFSLLILSGCAEPTGGGGWSTDTYFGVCDLPRSEPGQPGCLYSYREFYSRSEFESCKQSVENFIEALDEYQYCAIEYVNKRFLVYMDQAVKTIECLERELPSGWRTVAEPNSCDPVPVANIDILQILDSFKVPPICLTKKEYFPKYREDLQLQYCRDDVVEFGKFMRSNIDSSEFSLHRKLQNKADAAVESFNWRTSL